MSLPHVEVGTDARVAVTLGSLVPEARRGDEDASGQLMASVHRLAHRYARARLGTYPAAAQLSDDVAQEVCIAVLSALPRYEERGVPFEAYVYRIAARKVADAQRTHARDPVTADHLASPVFDVEVDGPEQHVLARDEAARAWSLLETLSSRQREVLVLRVAVGLSTQETADALGMSVVAVRVTQLRGLRELRRRWTEAHR
jgi:RNA polymerase sigma-70 factor (ECF subfamily)